MIYNDYLYKILCELGKENNFKVTGFSQNYIIEVKKNKDNVFYVYGNCFPLNNATSQKLCADKSALSQILQQNKIDCVKHKLFKHPSYDKNSTFKNIKNELENNSQGVVCKDNKGFCGNNVFLAKTNYQLKKAIKQIFKNNLDLAISPFVNFEDEFRLIMLNNECKVCYKKIRPFVIGNGKDNVKTLLGKNFNNLNFKIKKSLLKTIPKNNEKITLNWKHNLKLNSTPQVVTDKKLKQNLINFAKKVTTLLNLNFCSVDLIIDKKIKVLEVNSIVSMNSFANFNKDNYNKTKEVFLEAVNNSFNK